MEGMIKLSVCFALTVLLLFLAAPVHTAEFKGRCIAVVDGDSLIVQRKGRPVEIRLWGVDAPEWGQPYRNEAKEFVIKLALNKRVTARVHDWDRYTRTVAEIMLPDGRDLGQELVRVGLAWWSEKYAPDEMELKRLQAEARKAGRGLWSQTDPVAPWTFRKR